MTVLEFDLYKLLNPPGPVLTLQLGLHQSVASCQKCVDSNSNTLQESEINKHLHDSQLPIQKLEDTIGSIECFVEVSREGKSVAHDPGT